MRRLICLVNLLGLVMLSGCSHWAEYGQGGAAEDLPNRASMDLSSESAMVAHELRQDFNYTRQYLDVLILRGAQHCFPASVYSASLRENRVFRELAGGLLEDAENSLLDLRIELQQLEQKLDAIDHSDSCWDHAAETPTDETSQVVEQQSDEMPAASPVDTSRLTMLLNSDNQFAYGSHEINPKYLNNLNTACAMLIGEQAISLRVIGHTDASGDSEQNHLLSFRRAMAVVSFLTSCGIDEDRIHVFFQGENEPQFAGRSPEIDLVNRRVTIELDLDSAGSTL